MVAVLASVVAALVLVQETPPAAPVGGAPDEVPATQEERQQIEQQRPIQVGVPAVVEVHNEMGKRFKLTEATVMIDAVEVAHVKAPAGGELEPTFRPFAGPVPPGEHAVTV